jgi:hypothetical protein
VDEIDVSAAWRLHGLSLGVQAASERDAADDPRLRRRLSCGGWVYCDDGLPETYRGRIFHCEWGQGKVLAVKVAPDGAGFKFTDQIEFLLPGDVKDFRPFSLRPMADGRGFYMTDWGYSGRLNATKAGRLWKVTYTGDDVKPAPRGKDTDSVEHLIKALDHPAHSERLRAQRELLARGKEGRSAVYKALKGGKLSARGRRHALWLVAGKDTPGWKELSPLLLKDPDAGVRLEATRALVTFPWEILSKVELSVFIRLRPERVESDSDPSVRMYAAEAWFYTRPGYARVWAEERDKWVRFAVMRSAQKHTILRTGRDRYLNEDFDEWAWLEKELRSCTAEQKKPGVSCA